MLFEDEEHGTGLEDPDYHVADDELA